MIGKIILPWFGGSGAVWSTCLLFFQAALLAGYLYAHLSTRYLKPKGQAALHMGLMAVSLAVLPILPSPAWKPEHAGDPSIRILLLLSATVGLPYMLLATTSPLLQSWYVASRPGAIPYRLFALSNFGSLLALFAYPALVEPQLATRHQAIGWSAVYAAFVVLCSLVAWQAFRNFPSKPAAAEPVDILPANQEAPSAEVYILWIALAACASALLLCFTTHMSQNVAPIPFLWVLPLGTYLLTFILCFEREKIYQRIVFLPLMIASLGTSAYAIYFDQGNPKIKFAIPLFAVALFLTCMVCHGELVRLKPHPRYLTHFYLMISLGGALGGLFVAVGAPHLFQTFAELPILMVACPALAAIVLWIRPGEWLSKREIWLWVSRVLMSVVPVILALYLINQKKDDDTMYELSLRNFYGVLRVREMPESEAQTGTLRLLNGTINHGTQLLDPARRDTPTAYYGPKSGMGRAIKFFQAKGPVRVGVVGLGAGVTAAYCRQGDFFRFYDINPLDFAIAQTRFSFLRDCAADHEVLLGDARLTMESQKESQQFDVLAIDAFTSDAIPVHLLTQEAVKLYFRHLKPNGILAVHVSNRYLNLVPVVSRHARDFGKIALDVDDDGEDGDYMSSSDWVLVSADRTLINQPQFQDAMIGKAQVRVGLRPWTDDYSNLFQILK